jgi:hypothetical protein
VQSWADKAMSLGNSHKPSEKDEGITADFVSEEALSNLTRFLSFYQQQLLRTDTQRGELNAQLVCI